MRRLRKISLLIPVILILLCGIPRVYGQDYQKQRQDLVKEQRATQLEIIQLKDQIESYRKQISENETKFQKLNSDYQSLSKEIVLRNALIKKLQNEQQTVQHEIEVTQKSYQNKEDQLKKLIAEYQRTLTYLYMHGRDSQIALILTSHSLNQMLVRSYYLRKFDTFRSNQEAQIKEAQQQLEQRKQELEGSKKKNDDLLADTRTEKGDLEQRQHLQRNMITKLKKDRGHLQNMVKKTRKQVDDLNTTLNNLIAEADKVRAAEEKRLHQLEAERQKRLAEAELIKDPAKRAAMIKQYSTPVVEKNEITDSEIGTFQKEFASEKGNLPWPVDGVVTAHFGTVTDPLYGTKIPNLGIDIAAPPQTPVHAVCNGYVFGILPVTGYGDLVLVNHGRYKTVYGNLSQVMVHKNMIINKGDVIGLSGDKNSAKGEVLFFMVRDGKKNVNPESWLSKQ
ncbi:MAG TPA: peptidoglycan DD-metalloendopeptidase family protein [Balneolales bacterium]|nr:peptidoglycan DD-metalloendopeptidase family protein [Balneolales bacterium]